jgi:hypothetical protein
MMLINARSYADFVTLARKLRDLDFVGYKASASVGGGSKDTAFAIDYHSGTVVTYFGGTGTLGTITTDFPSAVALSDYLQFGTTWNTNGTQAPFL